MPFDWREFLVLAETLLESRSEAAYRSAISRAYYSVYNQASERAQKNECKFDPAIDAGMHKKCWGFYRKGPDPNCAQLGVDGDRLRESRVRADYRSGEYRRLQEEAAQIVKDVKLLAAKLAALDPRYPLP
jgi:hypothetical protein